MKANKILLILSIIVIIIIIIISITLISIFSKNKENTTNEIDINSINKEINDKQIVKESNQFEFASISDSSMAVYYFNLCIEDMLYNKERAFNTLDKNYKEQRFNNIDDFNNYIQKREEKLKNAILRKYKKRVFDEYTQYVLMDQNDNYYIINETSVMQYTLILDTYTIAIPEYIEKYEKSNNQQKTAYCIERFIQAINDENYNFAYSLLSDGFKNNYFKTQEIFEQYINTKLKGKSKVTYKTFNTQGEDIYSYEVSLIEPNENINPVEKTFIIKLKQGTDFEMSFNIE